MKVAYAGHVSLQSLGEEVGADRHAVLILHVLQIQAVITRPDQSIEDGGVLAGGNEHLEHAGVHGTGQLAQIAHKGVQDAAAAAAEVDAGISPAAGVLHSDQHAGDILILVDRCDPGQVDGPEGHGPLLYQGPVHCQAGLETHILPVGEPAGGGHGLLVHGQRVLHHGHGGKGIAGVGAALGRRDITVLIRHGDGVIPVALAPQKHGGGEHRLFEVVVGAHEAGGVAGIDEGAVLEVVVHHLPGHEGLTGLALRHGLQHHHAGGGAHLLLDADTAVDHLEDRIIGVAADVPDLQDVLDLVHRGDHVFLRLPRLRGPELGGVEIDGDLAGFIGGKDGVRLVLAGCANVVAAGAEAGSLTEGIVLEHAAPDGDLGVGQGAAVRLHQGQLRFGRLPQAEGVQGVELQLSGVLLAGLEVLMVDGAHVLRIAVLGAEPHVAGDSVRLIEGQHAFDVGGGGLFHALAVHIAQGGLQRRGHLEEVELVLQGVGGDGDLRRHAGGGMGGGDGCRAVLHRGHAHFQLGQVGVEVKELDILVQTALLVVHRDIVVVGGPGDAVLEGVPAVIVVVDTDVVQQTQLLPHGEDAHR